MLSQNLCTNAVEIGPLRCIVAPNSQPIFVYNKKKTVGSNVFEFIKTKCISEVEAMNLESQYTFHVVQGEKLIDLRDQEEFI